MHNHRFGKINDKKEKIKVWKNQHSPKFFRDFPMSLQPFIEDRP